MKLLYLSFLWHMHQPYYKDEVQQQYLLPWVFLHSIKDYYEMPSHLRAYPDIKAVFNFVPSLLIQIEDYATGRAKDPFLSLIRMETQQMNSEQKITLLPQLFMANTTHMIQPLTRFEALHSRYANLGSPEAALKAFDTQDFLDLKVLFLLSWTGNFIRKQSPFIQYLLTQGMHFSEDQKNRLLDELLNAMNDIIGIYTSLLKTGQIEISATPFYHPILPLLLNPACAKQAKPDICMPTFVTPFKEDAHWHVTAGKAHVQSVFGRNISGMWPAEGSVSNQAASVFAQNGVKWIASDEDVLFQSLGKDPQSDRSELYKPHRVPCGNDQTITLFCRDKGLSDLIGFTYNSMDGQKAAMDFISRLRTIWESHDFNPHVSIILDGENAWEFYPENGAPFFTALYEQLSQCEWLRTLTFSQSLTHPDLCYETLPKIRAGSWIYGDFTTWMGHKEKNQGWELLSQAFQAVSDKKHLISKQDWQRILHELHIAQGSDWFWWYGDDHFSPQADIFDQLFRSHLINLYKIAALPIPSRLHRPIKQSVKTSLIRPMSGPISPRIDGIQSSFFEWLGAARYDLTCEMGSMHTDQHYLKSLTCGRDHRFLYVRLEGSISELAGSGMTLVMEINHTHTWQISCELTDSPGPLTLNTMEKQGLTCAVADFIEMQIPLSIWKGPAPDAIDVQFKLLQTDTIVAQAPLYTHLAVDISNRFMDDWMV